MDPAPLRQESPRPQEQSPSCRLLSCPFLRPMSRAFFRFCAWGCVCLALCAVSRQSAQAESAPEWTHMPAGARATYIGIHGGTVPVSLLTSRDGTHMVALVGQTGNDFLRTLRVNPGTMGALPPPPDAQASPDGNPDAGPNAGHDGNTDGNTDGAAEAQPAQPHLPVSTPPTPPPFRLRTNATLLMAGTAVGAMPVIYATGHSFAALDQLYTDSLLFGISEHSPLLEGAVKAPLKAAKDAKGAKRRPLVYGSSGPPLP